MISLVFASEVWSGHRRRFYRASIVRLFCSNASVADVCVEMSQNDMSFNNDMICH